MERYKQYKQTNNLLHVFSLTLFIFASLFSVTGIVYSLVTVGIGSPLFLLCSIGFATCTMLSAYNAYAICNNITHRRGAPKKGTACSTNEKLIRLEDNLKNLNPIDFNNQSIPNKKYDTQQYISCVPETDKEILTPKIVQDVEQNKLSLASNDEKSSNQLLRSPGTPQVSGTGCFAVSNPSITSRTNQQSNNTSNSHQPQKNSTSSIYGINTGSKSKTLPQSQNISNPSKSTMLILPSMPIVIYDNSKVLSQSQAAKQSNSNERNNIKNDKEKIDQQPNSVASEFQAPPPPPPMPENSFSVDKPKGIDQLQHIKDISQTKLECIDESEKDKYSKSGNRNELLEDIRKNTKLRHFTDEEIRQRFKAPENDESLNLKSQLKKRAEDMGYSDEESGSTTPGSDYWEDDDVQTPPKAQVEDNNKSTEDRVEDSDHRIDSGISDGESSPEKINNHIDKGRRSSSNSYTEGSVEQPKNFLSHSSSCPSFIAINMNTL
ncbi:hypothetical protein [Candidatus Mesenet endosymbiont of Phosphuga atrata]|uniref:hypothetical protein n=1 Tax=Candidatus Mesenet endosymbiont of Phosphuga atrata TaxID=3066221 RepID=UPI0030D55DF2